MPPAMCEDCNEIRKIDFQLGKISLDMKDIALTQSNKDIEHETMIQNVTTRMDTMCDEFKTFKKEVREDIQNIKQEIPDMFDNAVNKLLAKMLKYVAIGVVIILAVIILGFTRPVALKGIDSVRSWVENIEVTK